MVCRIAPVAVAAVLVVGLLAACDDADEAAAPTGSSTEAPATATQPGPTEAPATATQPGPTEAADPPPTAAAALGPGVTADCAVVLDVIGEIVRHPDTAEAVDADPATADEVATREAFDAVATRFAALELVETEIAAAVATVAERARDVAFAEGTAVGLVDHYGEAFVALSDRCAPLADARAGDPSDPVASLPLASR